MSAKTTELKPCPFCGSGNVRYKEAEHAVVCARCKARGSITPDEEMAIRMWDERAGELKPADECPDGPRYKAIGNSMAVPVMRWIGERIAMAEAGEIA